MKYKIKFEIDLSGMDKQELRDYKIDLIKGDLESTEVEIDPNMKLPIPEIGSNIILSNKEFTVISMKYSINSDEYVIILDVKLNYIIGKEKEERRLRELDAMRRAIRRQLNIRDEN